MKRSLILLFAYSTLFVPVAIGQGREGNFRNSQDSQMGQAYPYWSVFLHPHIGYQFPVPPGMRAVGPLDAPETSFVSSGRDFVISAWGGQTTRTPSSLLEEEWRTAQGRSDRTVNYRRKGGSWFVVSGTERDGTEFYEKFVTRGNQLAAFSLKYPRSRLHEFEPWVEKIEDGFRIVSQPSRTSGEAPRTVPPGNISRSGGTNRSLTDDTRPATRPAPSRADDQARTKKPERTKAPPAPEPGRLASEENAGPAMKVASKEIPVGTKVKGRPGFVHSPYISDKSLVDVVGIPSGTKVRCPYTDKVFLVP